VRKSLPLLMIVLAGCRRDMGVITLGAAGGWSEPRGTMARHGIELALDEVNAASDEPHIRVIYKDDQSQGDRAAAVAQEFVDDDSVVAVIGHLTSGAMKAAAKVYDERLPAVATAASSPELTGISPWAFRVIASDSASGIEIGRFASRLGRRRAAILYESSPYGRGLADAFRRNFAGTVISFDPIAETRDQNFEPFVSWFRAQQPDVIFVAGSEGSGLALLREVRRQGLQADLMGGVGWRGIAADTALAEGVWVGVPFSADNPDPSVQRFVTRFRERWGTTPDAGAALAYDATRLLATAARRAGADRARIRHWLVATNGSGRAFNGVTGLIRLGPDGDPIGKSHVMTRVRHGHLVVEAGR